LSRRPDLLRLSTGELPGEFSAYLSVKKDEFQGMIYFTGKFILDVAQDSTGDHFIRRAEGQAEYDLQMLGRTAEDLIISGWFDSGKVTLQKPPLAGVIDSA
jgi:hypothetical protein